MDKRKLILNTGLHKNLQLVSQSLERTGSITSNKQTSSHAINIAMQEKFDLLHDGKLSDIGSSKSLNSQSKVKNKSLIENKEIHFRESEKDMLKKDNFAVDNKLLKTKTLISKQFNSQILESTAISQQDNNHLSGEGVPIMNKSLHVANRTVGRKRKITSSPEEASDSDLDFLYNERTAVKKKRSEITSDKNSQHIAQDINLNRDSTEKRLSLVSKSSVKPNTRSSISQKKQQDKESVSSTELKKYRLNKNLEECRINTEEYFSKKQDFRVLPVFSNFLQKCGITISNNGIHILSKYFFFLILCTCLYFLFIIKEK